MLDPDKESISEAIAARRRISGGFAGRRRTM